MRALLSVYDKTGLTDFARALHDSGYSLVSTGGTQAAIANAGIPVQHVEDLTGFPEILDGRVKSLHPLSTAAYSRGATSPSTTHNLQSMASAQLM